jgi:hypothetical protein
MEPAAMGDLSPPDEEQSVRDLSRIDQEQLFVRRSLADLDAERAAGDIDERDYEELRAAYTARALKPPVASPSSPRKNTRAAYVIFGAIAGVGILVGVLLAHNAGTRLPGDNVSGQTPTSPAAKLDAEAQQQIQKSDIVGAIKTFDAALRLDPKDAQALAYKGWLLRLAGSQAKNADLVDRGLASIRQAEAANPSYPDAHFFAGETLLRDKADPRGAIVEFEQFLADDPSSSLAAEVRLELQSAQAALRGP